MASIIEILARRRLPISENTDFRISNLLKQAWRVLLAKIYLRHCSHTGSLVRLWGRPKIKNRGVIVIGGKTRILSTIVPSEFVTYSGGRLEIGDHVYINYGASIDVHQLVRIGNYCIIGTYVLISDNDYHQIDEHNQLPPSKPVIIEDRVWVGDRVIVLKGVTIGRGSVIGAGSVVTKDIPPDSVAAGVPARIIRKIKNGADKD